MTDAPDTEPDHERPTDPSPPCQHEDFEELGLEDGELRYCFSCGKRFSDPSKAPTDPSPPPDAPSSWPNPYADGAPLEAFDGWRAHPRDRYMCRPCAEVVVGRRGPQAFVDSIEHVDGMLGLLRPDHPARCDHCQAWGDAYVYRTKDSLAPPLDSGALALAPAVGTVTAEEHGAPKVKSRNWTDFGLDTGPRLRVRGIADTNDVFPLVEPEPTHDPREIDAIHAASAKAMREGDDHTLGKIYEDFLDDVNSSEAGEAAHMNALVLAAQELQAAITAELREVARQEKNWGWAHSLSEHGIKVRARTPQGEVYECQVDRRGTQALVTQAITDPRGAASQVVRNARDEIHNARARVMVGGHVPVQYDAGQA